MTVATSAAPLPVEGGRTEPIYICAAIGVFFFALQARVEAPSRINPETIAFFRE